MHDIDHISLVHIKDVLPVRGQFEEAAGRQSAAAEHRTGPSGPSGSGDADWTFVFSDHHVPLSQTLIPGVKRGG